MAGLLQLGMGVETRCAHSTPPRKGVHPGWTWALRHGRGSPLSESGLAWPVVRAPRWPEGAWESGCLACGRYALADPTALLCALWNGVPVSAEHYLGTAMREHGRTRFWPCALWSGRRSPLDPGCCLACPGCACSCAWRWRWRACIYGPGLAPLSHARISMHRHGLLPAFVVVQYACFCPAAGQALAILAGGGGIAVAACVSLCARRRNGVGGMLYICLYIYIYIYIYPFWVRSVWAWDAD